MPAKLRCSRLCDRRFTNQPFSQPQMVSFYVRQAVEVYSSFFTVFVGIGTELFGSFSYLGDISLVYTN